MVAIVAIAATSATANDIQTAQEPNPQGWWLNTYEADAFFNNAYGSVYEGVNGSATLLIGNVLPGGKCVAKKHRTSAFTVSLNLLNLTASGADSGARKIPVCAAGHYKSSILDVGLIECQSLPKSASLLLPAKSSMRLLFKRNSAFNYTWNKYTGCQRRSAAPVPGPTQEPISKWPGNEALLAGFPKSLDKTGTPPMLRGNFGPFQATKSFATGYYTRNGFAWMTRVGNEMTGVSGYFASYKCNGPYGYTAVALKVEVSKNGREYTSVASCETGKYDPKTKKLYIRVGEGTTCPSSSDGGFENALIQPLGSGDNIKPCS